MTPRDSRLTPHGLSDVAPHDSRLTSHEIAISVKNLSKKYRLYDSPQHRLKEALHPFRKKYHREFWALKDVSFDIKRGDTVGIIGKNGSGKSTLLQIICGVLQPSSGDVVTDGRISALLELGAGFNPEFTGRQNVYMNGAIKGFTKEEMDERFQAITEFADIGDFIDQPVKTYSSGMYVRLAFSLSSCINPEILIVDEALSVGDMFFQAKSMTRMRKMMEGGTTVLFVSHDVSAIKSICGKAILLDRGNLLYYDKADTVVEEYFDMKVKSMQCVKSENLTETGLHWGDSGQPLHDVWTDNSEFLKRAAYQRIQNGKANFINILLLNESGEKIETVEYQQKVTLRMAIEICEDIDVLCFGYHIRDSKGISAIYSDSHIENQNLHCLKKGEKYIIDWRFKASLQEGNYNIVSVLSIPIDIKNSLVDFCDFVPLSFQFSQQPSENFHLYGHVHWDNEIVQIKL